MAATSAAIVMRNPADAARAPLGPTNTTTGTRDSMIAVLMSRVEFTSPPGVRSTRTTTSAPAASGAVEGLDDELGRRGVDERVDLRDVDHGRSAAFVRVARRCLDALVLLDRRRPGGVAGLARGHRAV